MLAGCVTRSASDGGVSFRYEWWLPASIFAVGLICIPLGFFARKSSARRGWGLMIAGPVAAMAIAPSIAFESVFVDDRGFSAHSGIWGMTANLDLAFDGVRTVRIDREETGGRRSRQIEVLYFDKQRGQPEKFPLNNDIKIEAGKEIITRVQQRGIPVIGG
ncbi:MAG TPA: hypothetical protein VHY20_11195 [Pirellulales bacterium]|nr:hypothetical protein [Pirellulales bacterium]